MTALYIPFSNGSEFERWADRNCWECVKGWDERVPDRPLCPLESALFHEWGVPAWAIRRIGYEETHANAEPTKCADGKERLLRFVTLAANCRERRRPGDDGPDGPPSPDAPGQRFLWSDLFMEREDADRAPALEVSR